MLKCSTAQFRDDWAARNSYPSDVLLLLSAHAAQSTMNSVTAVSSRERILLAAKSLFARNGYENASTVAIARQAGTSESQLMKHFGNKQGLLLALFDDGWSSIMRRVRATCPATAASPQLLVAALESFMLELERDADLRTLLTLESRRVRKDNSDLAITQGSMEFAAFLEEILTDLQNQGMLRSGIDVRAARAALFGMTEGMIFDQIVHSRNGAGAYQDGDGSRKVIEAAVSGLMTEPAGTF